MAETYTCGSIPDWEELYRSEWDGWNPYESPFAREDEPGWCPPVYEYDEDEQARDERYMIMEELREQRAWLNNLTDEVVKLPELSGQVEKAGTESRKAVTAANEAKTEASTAVTAANTAERTAKKTSETVELIAGRIAEGLDRLTDMFRYGDAYVKRVGDYSPPKRP